jgi:hypothetical protein
MNHEVLLGGCAPDASSGGCAVSRALSTAASALLETVARLALAALVLVALTVRLMLVAALTRAAPDLRGAAAFGRLPKSPSV